MSYTDYIRALRKEQIFITVQSVYDESFDSTLGDVILRLNDIHVLPELPENLGNYFTWSGILVKKYLKKKGYKGFYKLAWLVDDKQRATLIVDCDTNNEEDAPVFE